MSSNASDNLDDPSDLITDKHFEAWGRIVYAYAAMEAGIKLAISGILGLAPSDTFILANPYTSLNLRNVAKSVAKLYLQPKDAETFVQIVGDYGAFARVRNDICHNRWTFGDRPNSLRPAYMEIRSGRADPKGYNEGESDYTLDDFGEKANDLFELNRRLVSFLKSSGIDERIARKIEEDSDAIAEALGAAATAPSSEPEDTQS